MIIKLTKEQIIDGRIRRAGEIVPVSSMPEDAVLIKDNLKEESEREIKDFKERLVKEEHGKIKQK